ncbi:hypothetical protein BDF22DRAFT_741392 [Syncephalis plumigaleata]|nr:hypothetical protein BDF22DRAFT_741392 [Syncephalis plumigaleata]
MEQVPAPIHNSTTTATTTTTTTTTHNGYSRAHIAALAKRLKVNMQNILQKANASQRAPLGNSNKENIISTALLPASTSSAYRQPLMQTPPKDNNSNARIASPMSSPISSTKRRTTKKKPPLLTPSSSLDPPSSSPSSDRRSTNTPSRIDNQRQCTPFTSQPANHIYLGINASTEHFPVIGGPLVGEFIANGPILISTAIKELQHTTPTKLSGVLVVSKKRPLEQSSQFSGNSNSNSSSKRKRANIPRSSAIDPSTLWDSDATDTDTETSNITNRRMASSIHTPHTPHTPSPARTKLPLKRQNTLLNMNISKVGSSVSSSNVKKPNRHDLDNLRSPSKSSTMNTTERYDHANMSYTPVVSIPQRDHSIKSRNTTAKPYVAIRSTPSRKMCQATRVRAVLVTGASEFDLANRSNGKNKSRSLPALPPPLLPKLHDARTMVAPSMTADINGQYTNRKPLPRLIPSISHTPNIILCRYCRKSCKGTQGCTIHWRHCEVKALAVDIKMANLRNDQFRCPCMIRGTDTTACHLKQPMLQHKTEAIRCPKCQMYAHIDCIWGLGRSYPTQYTCPLCEISLTEKQITALHDASRPTKKRVREYEKHLKELHRVVKNHGLSSTHHVPLPPPPPQSLSFTSSDMAHSIYNDRLSKINYHTSTGNRCHSQLSQMMAHSKKVSWLSTIEETRLIYNEEDTPVNDYDDDEIASDTNTSFTDSISDDEAAIFYEGDDSEDDHEHDNLYSLHQHHGHVPYIDSSNISPTIDAHTLSPLALHLKHDPLLSSSSDQFHNVKSPGSDDTWPTTTDTSDEWSDPSSQVELLNWLDNEKDPLAILASTQCLVPLAMTSTDTSITATSPTSMMTCSDPWISSVSATSATTTTIASSNVSSNTSIDTSFINKKEPFESMKTIDNKTANHDDIWTLDMGEQIAEMFNTFINPDMVH